MNNNVFHPKNIDIPHLKFIWQSCFNDNEKFIDGFFDNCYDSQRCLAYYDKNKPVGMLFMLDSVMNLGDMSYKTMYLYAVATLAEYRGKGIMRLLEEKSCEWAKKNNYSYVVLIPQTSNLFKMYEKLGYSTQIYRTYSSFNIKMSKPDDCVITKITQENYLSQRKKLISDNFIVLGDMYDKFISISNEIYDIHAYKTENQIFIGYKNNAQFEIIELYSHNNLNLDSFLAAVSHEFNVSEISFKNCSIFDGVNKPYGMIKSLYSTVNANSFTMLNTPIYMNLMLD